MDLGVEIPGISGHKLPGLIFADDIVVLAPTQQKLSRLLARVESWANQWEMSIGAPKCGVTVFYGDINTLKGGQWVLQGQAIPVVETYTYLGIEVNTNWDLTKSVTSSTKKAQRALWSLRPTLASPQIPLDVKALIIRSLIVPVAAYGGELFGMQRVRAKGSQKLID